MSDSSVYQLITQLCSSLLKEPEEFVEGFDLKSAKKIAFEVLLKNHFFEIPESENLIKELQFSSFELSIANRYKDAQHVNDFIEEVKAKPSVIETISWCLVHLKNIDQSDEAKHQVNKIFAIVFFTQTYRLNPSGRSQKEPNFFKIPSNIQLQNKKNVYMPVKSSTNFFQLPTEASTPDDECHFFSEILDSYTGNAKKKRNQHRLALKSVALPEPKTPPVQKIKSIHNWENLEDNEESPTKSFSSEVSDPILLRLSDVRTKAPVEIRAISFEKLINDIKLLSIGIQSESFKRPLDDPLTFKMPFKLSCGDISDVSDYVEEFLEVGTCYKRLKTFTSKNPFNQCYIFEGFIFQAFCDCVIKFLNYYRDVVYSQEVETLLEFSSNTKSIRNILIHLSKFLKIHPSVTFHSKLPSGSDFLGMLYNEYTTVFNNEVKCFYVECLKSCCLIYFGHFHKWLFNGFIDDPYRELFVYFVDHYRPNTKYFFDKAYLIRQQSVPGFLNGCAETVLLCGKYTMLLKSFNQVVSGLK